MEVLRRPRLGRDVDAAAVEGDPQPGRQLTAARLVGVRRVAQLVVEVGKPGEPCAEARRHVGQRERQRGRVRAAGHAGDEDVAGPEERLLGNRLLDPLEEPGHKAPDGPVRQRRRRPGKRGGMMLVPEGGLEPPT